MKALKQTLPQTEKEFKQLSRTVKSAGDSMSKFGQGMSLKATAPLALFGAVALKQSANLETLGVSFETMLGSAKKSKEMMNSLLSFTATTPFQLQGVAQSAKQLLAFGVEEGKVTERLRMLGDVSAGAGVPLKDMASIFGKVKSKGKMMTEEILQMSDRGIPIVQVLADGFGVAKDKIFEMASNSQISFDVMKQALGSMTKKGGIFFNQTQKQSETLAGRWSTLKDNFLITSAAIGDVLVESTGLNKILKDMAEGMAPLAEKIKNFAQQHPMITKMILLFTGFVVVLGPLLIIFGQIAFAISSIIAIAPLIAAAFGSIAAAVGFLTGGLFTIAAAVLAATWPFLAIIAAIWAVYKVATLLGDLFAQAFPEAAAMMTDAIQETFGTFFGFIDDAGKRFDEFMTGIKNSGVAKIAAVFGIGADSQASSAQPATAIASANSQTDINMTVKAAEGTVEKVKHKTTGNGANVGVNMVNG